MIIKTLKDKNVFDETDTILIDELLYNIKLADDAKRDIRDHGFRINTVRDPFKDPYYQTNPSVSAYLGTTKNISALLTKLGITVQERQKLNLEAKEPDQLELMLTEMKTKN